MTIKETIDIKDDYLTRGIGAIVKIMSKIQEDEDDELVLDCSSIGFASPVFLISLMLCLSSCKKQVSVINRNKYLETVRFYDALKPDEIGEDIFKEILSHYDKKTFIPIISFPACSNRSSDKDSIMSSIENLLCRQLGIENNVLNGIKYIIGEMVDNITEHSESERGYIFAQSYPAKGYLDLCIADEGITLNGSFNKVGIEVIDDVEAMQAANKGVSSKNLPDAENRGYGIYTSKKMLIQGLEGQYMMMSGNALYLYSAETERIIELPGGLRWDGTVIALRLPYQNKEFRYTLYFE